MLPASINAPTKNHRVIARRETTSSAETLTATCEASSMAREVRGSIAASGSWANCTLLINPNGGLVMSDSDGSHSYPNMTQETIQEEPEDPGPRPLRHATRDVNGRRCLRA